MKQTVKTNEVVGMKNRITMAGGNKRLVRPFRRQDLQKYIGYVLLAVTYGRKGHKLWNEIPKLLVTRHRINYKDMFAGKQI